MNERFRERRKCTDCNINPLVPELKGLCWTCWGKSITNLEESDIMKIVRTKAEDMKQTIGILKGILREKGEFTTDDIRALAPKGKIVVGWAPHIKRSLGLDSEIIKPGLSRYFPKGNSEPKQRDELLKRIETLQTNNARLREENEELKHIAETSIHYMLNPEEGSVVERLKKIFESD